MITLLSDRFAPTTSSFGFLGVPLAAAAEALQRWRWQLHGTAGVTELTGDLEDHLARLAPLTGGVRPREILVSTVAGDWTAYFDCGIRGTDAVSTVGHLSRAIACQGLAIRAVPHTIGTSTEAPGRYGSVQFELFGPLSTQFLNYVRTISVTHDGSRWRFDANGTVQDFEQADAYKVRRIRDRFTSLMLADYCAELGVRPFDSDFFGNRAVLIESPVAPPPEGMVASLADTQRWLGIVPGIAEHVTG